MNKDIKQLEIQNIVFLVFSIISLLNIKGDKYLEEYLLNKNNYLKIRSNNIFKFTIKITIIIYIFFLIRNIDAYNNISNDKKDLYLVKVYGSIFLLVGSVCLLYFQENETSFIGAPAT